MKRLLFKMIITAQILCVSAIVFAQSNQHPAIFISSQDGLAIKKNLAEYPLLNSSFKEAKKIADEALVEKMDVPVPKDPAGGYTHERHQKNYKEMYNAGLVYTITGEKKYADFVIKMLLKYAELIPTLKNHPESKPKSPGKLFWQPLNDANWMVYSAIAYDCVYDYASADERKKITDGAFRPMCDFITIENKYMFNLIHNHGVWACAAVGMTGLVIGDKNLVQESLYGSDKEGKSGFIAQMDKLFSPDGYYTEGPYYTRYALLPFYLFAEALQSKMPQLKIFERRNQILKKAVYAALQQTNTNGAFFPINDDIKDKTYVTSEMVFAVDIAFAEYGQDPDLLSIVAKQKRVLLNRSGLKVAEAVKNYKGELPAFPYKSVEYTDGPDGKQGGITLLRTGDDKNLTTVLFKYASHGLSHGHYDELNMLFYDDGNEILQDYGSARFLNVEQKDGGRYLPENKSFAEQTIAHNTLTVDETSQFGENESVAQKYHADKYFSSLNNSVQVVSAKDSNAYPGVKLQRTLLLIQKEKNQKPICIDVFKVSSGEEHQYDLPFWYKGQFIAASFKYNAFTETQKPIGNKNGYQYIWNEAEGKSNTNTGALTILNGNSYYTITTTADAATQFDFLRTGASDPDFNLRSETGFLVRKKGKDELFASVIEPHGVFNPVSEISSGSQSSVNEINTLVNNDEYTGIKIVFKNKEEWTVLIANADNGSNAEHTLIVSGKNFSWAGPYEVLINGKSFK